VLLVLDEFSAVQGGTEQAIHLAERLRDVGVPVVFGAQSPEGLGDARQQWRLLHSIGGGLVLHQTADPDTLVQLAGTVRVPEQAWQLDPWGPAGQARVHMADRPRVDPNQVRQLHPGEAFLVHGGRAVKLSVLQAPMPARIQEEASALRAAAMGAAEPVYVAEGIDGASPQVELWRPSQPTLDQPDHTAPVPALEAPSEAAAAEDEAGDTGPAGHAPPAPPARPATGGRPARPRDGCRRGASRPSRRARLGPYRRADAPPRRRPLAALAAPTRLPALAGPCRSPEAGAAWLRTVVTAACGCSRAVAASYPRRARRSSHAPSRAGSTGTDRIR
jgi:hypothetical protein